MGGDFPAPFRVLLTDSLLMIRDLFALTDENLKLQNKIAGKLALKKGSGAKLVQNGSELMSVHVPCGQR